LERAQFVGGTRPGFVMDPARVGKIPSDRVTIVEVPALAISSTDVRRRSMRGEPVWYLVPDGVVQYVAQRRLYPRTSSAGPRSGQRSRDHEPTTESSA
jgi:nicotinate-nucleotide adenylyltransferase